MKKCIDKETMKKFLIMLFIIPFLSSCGGGGGGQSTEVLSTTNGSTRGNTSTDGTSNRTAGSYCTDTFTTAKIKIEHDGVYKVSFSDLKNACVDLSGIKPDSLVLENQGVIVPLKVIDANGNNLFDEGDSIEFYGTSIHKGDPRFRYTDINVYWLYKGNNGKQMKQVVSLSDGPVISTSFSKTLHMEKDTHYVQQNYPEITSPSDTREHWFWGNYFIQDERRDYTFVLTSIDTGQPVDLKVYLQSKLYNQPNRVRIYINTHLLTEEPWQGIYPSLTVDIQVPVDYLQEGLNTLSIEDVEGTFYLDGFDITSSRFYVARDNVLYFTGKGKIELSGFTGSNISIYDITDPLNVEEIIPLPIENTSSGIIVTLVLPQDAEKELVALTEDIKERPYDISSYKSKDIKSNEGNYIIITHKDFVNALTPLVEYRSTKYTVITAVIDDIYDEFSHGIRTPQAIKDFLKYAYENWSIPPEYVLLVGDSTFDFKDILGYGSTGVKDYVPSYMFNYYNLGEVPSDEWFADINDDNMPELAIGRIPAKTSEHVQAVIDKIIADEGAVSPDNITLIADSGSQFEDISDWIGSMFVNSAYNVDKVYRSYFGDNNQFASAILDALNKDSLIVNFAGHGAVYSWTSDPVVFSSGKVQQLNNVYYPFLVVLNCLNGYFIFAGEDNLINGIYQYPSIAESFLLTADRGAVAVFAPSAIGYPSDHDSLAKILHEKIIGNRDIPIGVIVKNTLMEGYTQQKFSQDVVYTYILFGDPATVLKN